MIYNIFAFLWNKISHDRISLKRTTRGYRLTVQAATYDAKGKHKSTGYALGVVPDLYNVVMAIDSIEKWELGVTIDVCAHYNREDGAQVHMNIYVPEDHWLRRCKPLQDGEIISLRVVRAFRDAMFLENEIGD